MNYSNITHAAIKAAQKAGAFLEARFNTPHTIHLKEGKQNLVTECDTMAESIILSDLQKEFPCHNFLAEESGGKTSSSDISWVIDPIDGTVNFARGIPHFSVSIAAYKENEILSGVIFHPITKELFVAEKNKGAFLNGTPLLVSEVKTVDSALLATGFPYNIDQNPMNTIDVLSSFLNRGCPIRRFGSAALDLAYVAAGRFDIYFETGIKPWDVAAGVLLIQEAKGMVSKWNGNPYNLLDDSDILATNTILHEEMVELIRKGTSSWN